MIFSKVLNAPLLALPSLAAVVLAAGLCASLPALPALAESQQVLVTVNDVPITSFDVKQRINLWKLVGRPARGEPKREALDELINDVAKIEEAKKFKVDATDKEIDERLDGIAKSMKTDSKGLAGKLRAQGISISGMRQYVAAQIAFSRLLRGKYKENITVSQQEVDRKLAQYKAEIDGKVAKVMSDPRMQPITAYQLLEVKFPIPGGADAMTPELLQSRAIEANQFISKFKGCKSARSAASGIFNVKVGKMVEADGRKLPKQMKDLLDRTPAGRAIGPMRTPDGIQVVGYCGARKVVPPKPRVEYPTRQQVQNVVENEKFAAVDKKYSEELRKSLLIEYRDPSYAN